MPSSSARCAQFPRAQDKVHYYIKLKDLRDQLKGIAPNTEVQEVQYTFDLQLAQGIVVIGVILWNVWLVFFHIFSSKNVLRTPSVLNTWGLLSLQRMLKRWLSRKKSTIQVMKQHMEELTAIVRHMKANSAISLQMELVKGGARGIPSLNHSV